MGKCHIQGSVVFKKNNTMKPGTVIYLGIPTIETLLGLRYELKLLINALDAYAIQAIWGRVVDRLVQKPNHDLTCD